MKFRPPDFTGMRVRLMFSWGHCLAEHPLLSRPEDTSEEVECSRQAKIYGLAPAARHKNGFPESRVQSLSQSLVTGYNLFNLQGRTSDCNFWSPFVQFFRGMRAAMATAFCHRLQWQALSCCFDKWAYDICLWWTLMVTFVPGLRMDSDATFHLDRVSPGWNDTEWYPTWLWLT